MPWSERVAADVMSSPVKSVELGDSLEQVVHMLADEGVTGALVTDRKGRPVGVVSHADVVAFIAGLERNLALGSFYFGSEPRGDLASEGPPVNLSSADEDAFKDARVDQVMTPEVITTPADAPLTSVARTMVEKRVHRLLVERDGVIVGIVSTLDVLGAVAAPPRGTKKPARAR